MFFLIRIIGTLIIFFIFLSFLFNSFFGGNNTSNIIDTLPSIDINTLNENTYIENFGNGDVVFSSHDHENILNTGIQLFENTKYVLSLRDTQRDYVGDGGNYKVEASGIGEIYIDSETDPSKVFIYTPNNILKITLKNIDGTKEYTDIILYPNMFIVFDPSRSKFLFNADAIRVQTVFDLGYISQRDDIEYLKNDFFDGIFQSLQQRDNMYKAERDRIVASSVLHFSQQEMIQKYAGIFINDEKKKIFYKNMILKNYKDMLAGDNSNAEIIAQTRELLQQLRAIDTESYLALKNIAKIYFALGYASSTFGESLVGLYGFGEIYDETFDVSEFTGEPFKDFLEIHSQNMEDASVFEQYYLYFLSQQGIDLLYKNTDDFSLELITEILGKHSDIVENSDNLDTNTRISVLYDYGKLLEEIHIFLRGYYFLPERSNENLLELKRDTNISGDEISDFSAIGDKIFDIYEKNKKYLDVTDQRDRAIIASINDSKIYLLEYMSALKNYETYTREYDISKKNLLELGTHNNSQDTILTEAKLKEYFSQFSGISLTNAEIEIIDRYYIVKNGYIAGKSIDFYFYPDLSNRIQNIVLAGEEIPYIYKLDEIKDIWGEKSGTVSGSQKEKYDFTNFFTLTFFQEKLNVVEEFDFGEISPNEDKAEIVFKRDILLGDTGEFASLLDVMPVKYQNIRLQKNETNYDIFIMGAPLTFSNNETNVNYRGALDGQYVFSQEDHYFRDIKIRIYSGQETDIISLFDENEINVSGAVKLNDFSNIIAEISNSIHIYQDLYRELEQVGGIQNLQIQYSSRMRKMTFGFDLNSNTYTILLNTSEIESFLRGTTKLNQENFPVTEIRNYF